MHDKKHTHRLALLLALAVVALVVVSIDQFRAKGTTQQAAVLQALPYGQ